MRRKVGSLFVIFVVIIACFALLSRAVSVSAVANIKVVSASSQTITRQINVEGTLLMSSESGGYIFEVSILANEAQDIIGKEFAADITLSDGAKVEKVSLSSKLSEDGRVVLLQGAMPGGDFSYIDGSRAQVHLVVSSADYQKCLPVECIYQEGSRVYIYVVAERASLTGTQQGVQKQYVTVLDTNQVTAALDDSSVTPEQKVVVKSDRVIDENMRVRIVE